MPSYIKKKFMAEMKTIVANHVPDIANVIAEMNRETDSFSALFRMMTDSRQITANKILIVIIVLPLSCKVFNNIAITQCHCSLPYMP